MEKSKKVPLISVFLIASLFFVPTVSAHVTVKPVQVGVASYQTFVVSVPTEKTVATVSVKLVIPEGVMSVRPNVKPGWTIIIKKDEAAKNVTEIEWVKGSIPADQRDEFLFSAKTPSTTTSLNWKAYQTYADGSVVSWDQESETKVDDGSNSKGPYSVTKVINDLETNTPPSAPVQTTQTQTLSIMAILISVLSLLAHLRKSSRK